MWISRILGAVYLCVAAFMLGALPPSHWLIDLPLVLLPGVLLGVFIHAKAWQWLVRSSPIT